VRKNDARSSARNEALNRELDDATATLDAMRAAEAPYVEEQQAQPELQQPEFQPQPEAVPPGVDPEIAQALQSPKVRSLLEQVNLQFEQTKAQYVAATQQLATEAVATLAAAVPEFSGLTREQAEGAFRVIAQQNPQRAEAIRQLVGRTQNILATHQQQQAQEQARQRQQYQEGLAAYAAQEVKRYETLIAKDRSPEQIKALRENVFPMVERHYGIPRASLQDLYSGAAPVSGAEFMRSSAFQLMLSDAISYRQSREAVAKAVNRPVPNVQRPGISEPVRIDDGAVSAALARLNSPGGAEGRQGLRNAAALVAARRGGRG
jgi:hypothetical protein